MLSMGVSGTSLPRAGFLRTRDIQSYVIWNLDDRVLGHHEVIGEAATPTWASISFDESAAWQHAASYRSTQQIHSYSSN